MTLRTYWVLGWLALTHGLAHVVFPFDAPTVTAGDSSSFYFVVATVGFVAAGVGLLGLPPFDRAISSLLVLAAGFSLIAILRRADQRLWFGALVDATLLAIGLWRACVGWPRPQRDDRVWPAAGLSAALAVLLYVGVVAWVQLP